MRSTQGSAKLALLCLCGLIAACSGRPAPDLQEQQFAVFGTIVTISAFDTAPAQFATATAELERYFLQTGKDWYPWAKGELAYVNAAIANNQSIAVSDPLRQLLQRAAAIEERSENRFNAALGELSELWGFNEPNQPDWRPPAAEHIQAIVAAEPSVRWLRWEGNVLLAADRKMKLDPGGIAKGAILERARDILHEHSINNAIVDIGGDLIVSGTVGNRDARIGIRRPGANDALAFVEINAGEAVMTSGNYERYFEYGGQRYAHIIDPRTGYPAAGIASVTVIHRDAVLADAAATALLVAGADEFQAMCDALDIKFALLIDTSGDLRLTNGMESRLNWLSR